MVIETTQELHSFLEVYNANNCILVPVLCDDSQHPCNNSLSFLFIKVIGLEQYYLLPFNHNDCDNLDISVLEQLNNDRKKYVFDKKSMLHTYKFKNLVDINLLRYLNTNESFDLKSEIKDCPSFSCIKREYGYLDNLNRHLPILQHYEQSKTVCDILETIIQSNLTRELQPCFDFVNNRTISVFQKIEQYGLKVDIDKFNQYFPDSINNVTDLGYVYTEYNNFTATGRPSNRYGNVNYAALNKDEGERSCIVSRHGLEGFLLLFDYDAYHLRLIAKMTGFEFPPDINVHEYLGKFYFDKDTLTEEEYNQSKGISFEILYGGIDDSVANANPYFKTTRKFIDSMWAKFNIDGYTETILSKKKLYKKSLPDMNANKLFNYVLQNFETERNVVIIENIQNYLSTMRSKLVLYTYDGFMIDFDIQDGRVILRNLQTIIEGNGEFPTKIYVGYDFDNMKKVDSFM